MMKAIVYVRVSSIEQTENTSLTNQERSCRLWCEREGYEVAGVFRDEGESAKTKDRPELLRALDYARKQDLDAFVVWKVDRLSRNQLDFHQLRALLAGFGVQVKSATETLTDDPLGELMGGVLAAFAQFDNDIRGERARAGMRMLAREGWWVTLAPLGYLNKRTEHGKPSLVLDPQKAALIREGFEQVAMGQSQIDVLRGLRARGLRRGNNELCTQSWNAMLANPVYAGWITGKLVGPEPVRGKWEPIVSQDVFDRVQITLDGGRHVSHKTDRPDFPLRRFVRCARCNRPLTASWASGRSKKYPYYHCPGCKKVNIRKEALEEAFLTLLDSLRVKDSHVRLFRSIVLDVWHRRLKESREQVEAQRKKAQRLEAKKEKLLDLLLEGVIDEPTYKTRLAKIKTSITLAQIDERTSQGEGFDIEGAVEFAEQILLEPARMWRCANLKQRQQLQELLFPEKLSWDGKTFGTVVTCSAISHLRQTGGEEASSTEKASSNRRKACSDKDLQDISGPKSNLVGATGFEPATS